MRVGGHQSAVVVVVVGSKQSGCAPPKVVVPSKWLQQIDFRRAEAYTPLHFEPTCSGHASCNRTSRAPTESAAYCTA